MRGDVNGKVIEIKIYEAKICVCAAYTLKHTNNSKHKIREMQRYIEIECVCFLKCLKLLWN